MHYFALNLKFLRQKKRWSQEKLAKKIGLGRSTIADYERQKSEPSFKGLIQLAKCFEVSIDDFLKKDLKQAAYEIIKNQDMRVLAISVDKENKENIDLVPQKAQAGYQLGYADVEYIAKLPKVSLPNLKNKTYRAFEITGLSMLPIEPGSIILSTYVESFDNLSSKTPYIVVSKTDGIVFKRLEDKGNTVKAISDNPEFLPYTIAKKDILELWKFEALIAFTYNQPEALERIEKKLDVIIDKTNSF